MDDQTAMNWQLGSPTPSKGVQHSDSRYYDLWELRGVATQDPRDREIQRKHGLVGVGCSRSTLVKSEISVFPRFLDRAVYGSDQLMNVISRICEGVLKLPQRLLHITRR